MESLVNLIAHMSSNVALQGRPLADVSCERLLDALLQGSRLKRNVIFGCVLLKNKFFLVFENPFPACFG